VFSYRTARGFQNLFLRVSGIIFPVLVLFFFFFKMGPGTMGLQWDYQYVQNLMSTLPLAFSLLGLLLMVLFTSAGQIWNFFIDYGVTVSPVSQRVVLRTVYMVSTGMAVFFVALALRFSFSLGF
jgi:succinate dehydrogenase/fumarate reductase cytochrome b subunit